MKNILITGANSYIGTRFELWVKQDSKCYLVDTLDLKDREWDKKNFSKYDVVFHVAAIVHMRETKANKDIYYKVNRDLAFDVAKKAKKEGVKQFIFLSSMNVYGMEEGIIKKNTIPTPKSSYGRSKLEAEKLILTLQEEKFKVAVLRPPMVYGKGCKGNYSKLEKFAIKSPIFPSIQNKRSMLYIDTLCEFIRCLVERECGGIFFPQDKDYICTSEMVKAIADQNGKSIYITRVFNPLIRILRIRIIKKVFGNLIYEKDISQYDL